MKKKAVFFDIDGTIWDQYNQIPESTVKAIRKLRENGHLAFICSGRTRAYIHHPRLFEIGFDGIVAGCGTHVEYEGNSIFYKQLDPQLVEKTIELIRHYGFRPILEGRNYIYLDDFEYGSDPFGDKLKKELGQRLVQISDFKNQWEISKLSCSMPKEEALREACFQKLEPEFDLLVHNDMVAELVPKGYSKATGIQKVCEYFHISREDTFAFGDSVNDLTMLTYAGTGIAMGNGTEDAKKAADYVTSEMFADGIYKGLEHFALI